MCASIAKTKCTFIDEDTIFWELYAQISNFLEDSETFNLVKSIEFYDTISM